MLSAGYIITFLLLLAESYKNPNKTLELLGVDSSYIFLLFVTILLVISFFFTKPLSQNLLKINNYLILPLTFGISFALSILDFITPENFVFSKFLLNYQKIGLITVLSLVSLLTNQTNAWYKKNYTQAIFYLPIILLSLFMTFRLWPFDFFLALVREDGLIEWLQFIVLVVSAIISLLIFNLFHKTKLKIAYFFLFIAVIFLFLAGDEISWGQRIFHIQGYSYIIQNNTQSEITFHNQSSLAPFTWYGYILVSFLGGAAWFILILLPKKLANLLSVFTPMWYCFLFFLLPLVYYLIAPPFKNHTIGEWSEIFELILYMGFFFWLLSSFLKYKHLLKKI